MESRRNYRLISFPVLLLLGFLFTIGNSKAVETSDIFFDAITFAAPDSGYFRLDCMGAVPYQSLRFEKGSDGSYYTKYHAKFEIIDENEKPIEEKNFDKIIKADNYFSSQGGSGEFDYISCSFKLKVNKYKARLYVKSETGNKNFDRVRNVSPVDFAAYPFSMSGILLVSSIEEQDGNFNITPFISDNIAEITESFFTVFETYNKVGSDSLKYVAALFDKKKNEKVFQSKFFKKYAKIGTQENYLSLSIPASVKQGEYILRIYAVKKNCDSTNWDSKIIAGAERSVSIIRGFEGGIYENIAKSIEECRYAASGDEMKAMKSSKDEGAQIDAFNKFWAQHDPTPGTDRNELMELYFSRITYCEDNFNTTRVKGWRSDMGHVFVIYGAPISTERSTQDYLGRQTETWTYSNGEQFIFLDSQGFGDYRLYSPSSISDKFFDVNGQ